MKEANMVWLKEHVKYRKRLGKQLYVTRWIMPKIRNTVLELTWTVKGSSTIHKAVMNKYMKYCLNTLDKG